MAVNRQLRFSIAKLTGFIAFIMMSLFMSLLTTACGSHGATAQAAFINTSDEPMEISLIPADKTDRNSVLQKVPPHSVGFFPLPAKLYNVVGLNAQSKGQWLIEDYKVKETTPNHYLCFDLAQEFDYTLANAKFLYEPGNSFAEELAKSSGPSTLINGRIDASKPFVLDFAPVWPFQPLPARTNAMSAVWALAPRPKADIKQSELAPLVEAYLRSLDVEK